jgi:hypothetical protein
MLWRNTTPKGRKYALCLIVTTDEYVIAQWDPPTERWADQRGNRYGTDDVVWQPLPRPPAPASNWTGICSRTHELEPIE